MAVDGVSEEVLDYLVELLSLRVASKGKKAVADHDGKVWFEDCEIFERGKMEGALRLAISALNSACGSHFGLADVEFCKYHAALLVGYAAYILLGSQALLERGREYSTVDNGVGLTPPDVSNMAWDQAVKERTWWEDRMVELSNQSWFYDQWVKDEDE